MTRHALFLLGLGLCLPVGPARAVEDPCAAGGGTKVADTCDGYASSCCSLDRATRYWCVTYGQDDELKATCMSACGAATCGWKCDKDLTGKCITYPLIAVSGSYECGLEPVPDSTGKFPWTCPTFCPPSCSNKNCGSDGCGPPGLQGVCGQCFDDPTSSCPMACGANGKCDKVCADCFALGWTCGSNCCGGICGSCMPPSTCDTASHVCSCVPSCANKACGDDGCGGSCGSCSAGSACEAGSCKPLPAEPHPEVVEVVTDPGPIDSGAIDPGMTDPGASDQGQAGRDHAVHVDATDSVAATDGGCPDGTSLVSGICLKDPPQHDRRDDGEDGGSCQVVGAGTSTPAWVVLMVLLVLAASRRSRERG